MQNTQKKKRSRLLIGVALLVILTNLAVFGASAGFDGYYFIEDSYTSKPSYDEILSGSEWLSLMDDCAFWIAPHFDSPLLDLDLEPELLATGVGRIIYALYDEQQDKWNIYSEFMPLGVDSMSVHVVSDAYWIYDSNDNTNVIYDLPLTSFLYLFPIADGSDFWVGDEGVLENVAVDASDFGLSLEYGWHSYSVGSKYMFDFSQPIISTEYERGKSEGYDLGYADAYEDYGESPSTLLEFIAAIFSAPGYLINTIFDFEIFGINLANAFRVILTLAIVGLVVMFAIKYGGA